MFYTYAVGIDSRHRKGEIVYHYENELEQADIHTGKMSPMLLPNYARHER